MRKTPGRILISTFASNVLRVAQIIEAAVACGRKVAVFGRSMENVVEIGKKQGVINSPESNFIGPNDLTIFQQIKFVLFVLVLKEANGT